MVMKTSKNSTNKARELEKEATRLIRASKNESLSLQALSALITPPEQRQLLGAGNRRPISIRIPEHDLAEIRKIAKLNGRKYQQLIVQAVKIYIENYHDLMKTKKRRDL